MGRKRLNPEPPAWLTAPAKGVERHFDMCEDVVNWCFGDPNINRQRTPMMEYRAEKLANAVTVIQSDSQKTSLEYHAAVNELAKRGVDPESKDELKITFLMAKGCLATIGLLNSVGRDGTKNESIEGNNFGQAWKEVLENAINDMGYDREKSYRLFDTIFDNPQILAVLTDKNRVLYINGLEAELATFWYLKAGGMTEVKFADSADDQVNKVDILAIDKDGRKIFFQVKSKGGRQIDPDAYDVIDVDSASACVSDFERRHDDPHKVRRFRDSMARFRSFAQAQRDVGIEEIGAQVIFMPIRLDKAVERSRMIRETQVVQPSVAKRLANAVTLNYAK